MYDRMTLLTIIDGSAARGDRVAIQALRGTFVESWSYARLRTVIQNLSGTLSAASPAANPAIALYAANSPEWVAAYFAVIQMGGTAVPIDFGLSEEEAGRLMAAAGCRLCLSTRDRLERLRGLPGAAAIQFIDLGAVSEAAGGTAPPQHPDAVVPRAAAIGPDAEASLLFTSGTTGAPKIVPLTHRNLMHCVNAVLSERFLAPGERVLLPLPLHHIYPFTVGLLATLASGGTVIFPEGLSGPQITEAMQKTNPDIMVGVPRLYDALVLAIDGRVAAAGKIARSAFRTLLRLSMALRRYTGLRAGRFLFPTLHRFFGSHLRTLACGGAHLDEGTWERLEGLGWEVLTGYGLTETAPLVTFTPRGRGRKGTEGTAVPGVEVRIEPREETGLGEILVRGPNVFSGYKNNPAKTQAAFKDGWFRTGDLGWLDADGYLRVAGRGDELIVLPDGKKIFPERLERAYSGSRYIQDLAILAHGGRLVAIIVPNLEALRARGTARIKGLVNEEIELIGQRLARHERVSGTAAIAGPLPRTRLGKLRRHLLPEIYARAIHGGSAVAAPTARPVTAPPPDATPLEMRLWEWLTRRYPGRDITPDSSLQLDFGIDSVDWINLTLDLQQTLGVRLTDQALSTVITVRDLMRAVSMAETAVAGGVPSAPLTGDELRWLEPRGTLHAAIGWCLHRVIRLAMRLVFHLRVDGLDRLPASGPLIIAPNHASFLDPLAIIAALPWRFQRDVYWAAWTGHMFAGPIRRFASRIAQAIPVDQDRGPAAGLALATEVLSRRQILVWFPEGQRSPTGELLPFLQGVGVLIARTGSPVMPVHVSGTYQALPRGQSWPRPGRIQVSFGSLVAGAELESTGKGATAESRITDALHGRVAGLAQIVAAARGTGNCG